MKRSTLTLVIGASALYYAILFLAGSLFSRDFQPPLYFLAVPLLILVLVLLSDLSYRATVPTEVRLRNRPSRKFSRQVQDLTRQIEVGTNSSPAYFDKAVLARLRETLVVKVALETGLDEAQLRERLANPRLGPGLLNNDRLYRLLYSPTAAKGSARVRMLEEAIALVESWKP